MPGWGDLFVEEETEHQFVDDASAAMLIVFLLFIFPSQLSFWPFTTLQESRVAPALLDWTFVQKRFPWGVSILFGGGFALAAAASESGLSAYVGKQLSGGEAPKKFMNHIKYFSTKLPKYFSHSHINRGSL